MARSRILALLETYKVTLAALPELRRSLPYRLWFALATERFLIERMRTTLDVLERGSRAQAAVGQADELRTSDDIRRLRDFSASLPSRPSRWYLVAVIAAVIVIAQLLLSYFGHTLAAGARKGSDLATQLEKLASPSVSAPAQAVTAVLHTDVYGICLVGICLCLATYIVLRPFANGLIASRAIRDPASLRPRWGRFGSKATPAPRRDVSEFEDRAFADLDLVAPPEPPLDLAVSALPCMAALLLAFSSLSLYSHGLSSDGLPQTIGESFAPYGASGGKMIATVDFQSPAAELIIALVIGGLGAARLGQLANRYARRRSRVSRRLLAHAHPVERAASRLPPRAGTALSATLAALALVAWFVVYASADRKPPSVSATQVGGTAFLAGGKLTIGAVCDEPCRLAGAGIGRDFSLTKGGIGGLPNGVESDLLESDFNSGDFDFHRARTYALPLTAAQARWLRQQTPSGTGSAPSSFVWPAAAELDFYDKSDNLNAVIVDLRR